MRTTATPGEMRHARASGVVVILISILLLGGCGDSDDGGSGSGLSDDTVEAARAIDGVEIFVTQSQQHVDGAVDYPQTPPIGGAHNPIWATCGAYDDPIPSEQGVHSLEHGAVWITYRPDLAVDQVEALQELVLENPYVLVSPWNGDDLPAAVVASAWRLQLELDSPDDPRVAEFVERFANGPQKPEEGVTCLGGADQPDVVSRVPAG